MKKIILVRHAESPFRDIKIKDFDRPLNDKGVSEANLMGIKVKKYIKGVDSIITSGAKRAFNTSEIIAKNIDFDIQNIKIDNNIYNSSTNFIIDLLHSTSNEYKSIMVFGHNPVFHHLSQILSGEIVNNFPTCSMICIKFDVDNWININKGKKEFMIYPNLFK
jgi:phosphohistidine phosphatase|tara:strand:- start:684 stop:1172 length:489 start_codon:yes stop_codon:yes gene_type:complete